MNINIRKMTEADRENVVDMMRTFYHSPAVWTNGSEEIYNNLVEYIKVNTNKTMLDEEETTYYTSPGFSLSISIRGHFMIMDYFTLDGNKRVYNNIYLYEDDYFCIYERKQVQEN
mgnify:CR=1 FL=1